MERLFFHDLLNLTGSLRGFAELLQDNMLHDKVAVTQLLAETTERIIDEIETQRIISAAESGALAVEHEYLQTQPFLEMLLSIYRHHQCAENRTLALVEPVHNFLLKSDQELLTRILGNLIKNALEAPPEAATVRIDCRSGDDETIFSINNPGEMPKELQTRVFPAAGRPRAAAAAWACAVSACWSAHAVAKLTWSAIPQRGRLSCSTCQWLRGR